MNKRKTTAVFFFVVLILIIGFMPIFNYTRTSWIASVSGTVSMVDTKGALLFYEEDNYGSTLPLSKESCFEEGTIFAQTKNDSRHPAETALNISGDPGQQVALLEMLCGVGKDRQSYAFFLKYSYKPKVETGSILGDILGTLKRKFEKPKTFTYCTDNHYVNTPVNERDYQRSDYTSATTTEDGSVKCAL